MVLEPTFIVLDEPTSALDMLIQSQMVDLLRDLQKRRDLTYLFISHDLRVVAALASRLMVMRDGKVVEARRRRRALQAPQDRLHARAVRRRVQSGDRAGRRGGGIAVIPGPSEARNPGFITPAQGIWIRTRRYAAIRNDASRHFGASAAVCPGGRIGEGEDRHLLARLERPRHLIVDRRDAAQIGDRPPPHPPSSCGRKRGNS